ncbi:MAG: hypothetical protein NTV88_00300 [Candidatus Micrarchaeota archaeon]|nr:hypothetical protein [Candidatus Micrarchaeota archaeon]
MIPCMAYVEIKQAGGYTPRNREDRIDIYSNAAYRIENEQVTKFIGDMKTVANYFKELEKFKANTEGTVYVNLGRRADKTNKGILFTDVEGELIGIRDDRYVTIKSVPGKNSKGSFTYVFDIKEGVMYNPGEKHSEKDDCYLPGETKAPAFMQPYDKIYHTTTSTVKGKTDNREFMITKETETLDTSLVFAITSITLKNGKEVTGFKTMTDISEFNMAYNTLTKEKPFDVYQETMGRAIEFGSTGRKVTLGTNGVLTVQMGTEEMSSGEFEIKPTSFNVLANLRREYSEKTKDTSPYVKKFVNDKGKELYKVSPKEFYILIPSSKDEEAEEQGKQPLAVGRVIAEPVDAKGSKGSTVYDCNLIR